MADLLFGLPLRQRRARIYRYNDSILICSNQKLPTRCRFGRASNEYNTNLVETNLQRETNCYYALKPIDQADLIALQFYVSGGLLQVHLVVGDTTRGGKSTVSRAFHNKEAMLKTITVLTWNCIMGYQLSISETI